MSQPPQAAPEWIAMRGHHQQECAAFARQVETDRQALHRRHEVEKEEFARRVEATKTELLGRHSQQEGAYWTKHYQKQLKVSRTAPHPHPAPAPAFGAQATALRSNTTLTSAPRPRMLPKSGLLRKSALVKTEKYKSTAQNETALPAVQQSARPEFKQTALSRHDQQQTKDGTAGTLNTPISGPPKQSAATSNTKDPKHDVEIVDLCSSDDDILVEVSKADYQKKTFPAVASAPFRPSIPTATLQLFGETSQRQTSKPISTPIKQEKPEPAALSQNDHPSHLPQPLQVNVSKPPTTFQPPQLHGSYQNRDTTAPNARACMMSQRAATAFRSAQYFPQATFGREPPPFGRDPVTISTTHDQQEKGVSRLTANRATLPPDRNPFTVQQSDKSTNVAQSTSKKHSAKSFASGASDGIVKLTSDADLDLDDVPLASLDIPAILKKLGAAPSRKDSLDSDLRGSEVATQSITKHDIQTTQLPSPAPSLTPAPSALSVEDATSLLNKFKRPPLQAALRHVPDARGWTMESRGSSRSSVTEPDRVAPFQRQSSVISQKSNVSVTTRKRKQVDLSDDEQSEYLQPSPPFNPTRKASAPALCSPLKKPLKPKGLPLSFPSPISTAGKKTNGFDFRTRSTPTSPPTSLTPPRPSPSRATPGTWTTPAQGVVRARESALSTLPSKRKAAIRAQSNVQKMLKADEEFHPEDLDFLSSAQEPQYKSDQSTATLGKRLRSMSITPVPTETKSRDATTTSMARSEREHTRKVFLEERAKGADRLANRTRDIGKLIGESDEDDEYLDTSEFFFVGGVLLRKGQEGRLTDL